MSLLSDFNDEITKLQTQLDMIIARRDSLQQTIAYVNTQRPAGIPLAWRAHFTGRLPDPIVIWAWFDPTKFGDDLTRR